MSLSIGLPVYNGERYVLDAINTLRAQTFQDFELIVMDNASTDRTEELCRKAAAADDRIKYHRNEANIGPVRNFNRVFQFATRKYFKWAAHDDTYAADYLEKCVSILERHEDVVLCTARTRLIDDHGVVVKDYISGLDLDSTEAHKRFRASLDNFMTYEIFGVIRRDALLRTPLLGSFGHADGILLAWLSLQGKIHVIPEFLFFNRDHPEKSKNFYSNYRDYTVWLDPTKAGKILLPRWRMGYEYVRAVVTTRLAVVDRIRCVLQMLHWIRVFWKSLIANVVYAGLQILTRPVALFRRMTGLVPRNPTPQSEAHG